MKHENRMGVRFFALVLVGTFAVGLAAPSQAAESPGPRTESKATLTDTAADRAASLDLDAATRPDTVAAAQAVAPASTPDSEGFFKTGKGKAALAIFVVAAGATVYSKYHDRVKSGIR